ncbi:regulatory protein RecX [Carnimonas bestiolae]|uniref:regulatory protein RecX n=1 Tax=Carnimonas bestiolae TaxID=3402172 RepID=UPI003EDC87A2
MFSGKKSAAGDPPSAYDYAVMLLARREHSVAELRGKMARNDYAQQEISEAVEQLQQAGLQSDERFCEVFVRSRIGRGQGPLKIDAELRQRGVASALIALALEAADTDWRALAREVLLRKYASPVSDARERAKRLRFLASRGFNAEQSYAALAAEDDM